MRNSCLSGTPELWVRNDFECEVGTFQGAENPHTEAFVDFPDYVARELDPARDKKVAMFCTGGIRCERASALLDAMALGDVREVQRRLSFSGRVIGGTAVRASAASARRGFRSLSLKP